MVDQPCGVCHGTGYVGLGGGVSDPGDHQTGSAACDNCHGTGMVSGDGGGGGGGGTASGCCLAPALASLVGLLVLGFLAFGAVLFIGVEAWTRARHQEDRGNVHAVASAQAADQRAQRVDQCVNDPEGALAVVDCRQPHDAQIIDVVGLAADGDEWPGDAAIKAFSNRQCPASLATYLRTHTGPEVRARVWEPSHDGWDLGVRYIVCSLVRADGEPLTAPLQPTG